MISMISIYVCAFRKIFFPFLFGAICQGAALRMLVCVRLVSAQFWINIASNSLPILTERQVHNGFQAVTLISSLLVTACHG